MNRLLSTTSILSIRRVSTQIRPFGFKVGDKIPINYIKGEYCKFLYL